VAINSIKLQDKRCV